MPLGDRKSPVALGLAIIAILATMVAVLFFPVNCTVARKEMFCSNSEQCPQGA